MATIHIPEAEAKRDFAVVMARVRAGAEVVVEGDVSPPVLWRVLDDNPPRRTIEECIALLPENSAATIDDDFARDVAAAIAEHREPLDHTQWD
jgi:hypothetical protein